MLFGKKDDTKVVDEQVAPAPVLDKKAQKAEAKKAKDSLALVIDETEPGAALDLIRKNECWALPNGAGVILSLPVDAPIEAASAAWARSRPRVTRTRVPFSSALLMIRSKFS